MIDRALVAAEMLILVAVSVSSPLACTAVNGSFEQLYSGGSLHRACVLPRISSTEGLTQHPPNSVLTPAKFMKEVQRFMYCLKTDSLAFSQMRISTSAPRGMLCSSNLNAAPMRLRICGGFSPGSRG